ncbi:hypothetical protein Tco_1045251 [Tanacetum coccineum]|uniref:Uncharacterized protein n=1 Tax=Tanacetum coccineum TaxID=301880 RepID=A0ABQ5GS80_9ASTR
MDDPNITIEEYIRLEKEKARKRDETSLSKCDEEEQNVFDLFPFNVIYPNDSKSDKDNDDDKVDIEHSSGDLSVKTLPDKLLDLKMLLFIDNRIMDPNSSLGKICLGENVVEISSILVTVEGSGEWESLRNFRTLLTVDKRRKR